MIDPKTGLVAVVDTQPNKDGHVTHFTQHPVDWAETSKKGVVLKNGSPRFVLEEDFVAPDPA